MTNRIARIAAVSVMVLSFASPASAATVAELQAQINALMAQLSAMSGGATVSSSFTTDLTVGSKGAEVTALQDMLVAGGYLTMPAGVAKGYFGALTKAAVAKWQVAKGITPAAGYFGPKSRAAAAGSVTTTTTTTTTVPAVTGISTPGAEGTISKSVATVSNSTVYSGDSMVPVLAFKVKATNSDVAIQRLKVDLGTNNKVYTRAFSKIYLVDESGKTVASSELNSNTVVKGTEGTPRYTITLTGFSSIVAKDATKTFTVKADVMSFGNDADVKNVAWTFSLMDNAVRGVDGAGIDQYEGTGTLSKAITTGASLVDSANLTLSTNGNTPLKQEVIASTGSLNDQADKVSLLTFDLRAEKDAVLVTDLVATIAAVGTGAEASSTYLYVGDTLVGTASLSAAAATFADINYTIPKDTTKTFTIKADITGATSAQATITASVATSGISAENSNGDTVSGSNLTGSATGNNILVTNQGPVFSLVGTPTIVKGARPVQNNYATSTATATFNLKIEAVGAPILLGTTASGTPMVGNVTVGGTKSFIVYLNGAAVTPVAASSTDFAFPSSGNVVATGSNSVTLAKGQSITLPVSFTMEGNLATGVGVTAGNYSIGLEQINWVNATAGTLNSSTFMSGQTNWRSSSVSLP